MARLILALIALIASAAAFAPSTTTTALRTSVVSNAYVPDGLTAQQWADKQKKEAKAKKDNKVKVATTWGPGRTGQEVSLTEFQKKRDEPIHLPCCIEYPHTACTWSTCRVRGPSSRGGRGHNYKKRP